MKSSHLKIANSYLDVKPDAEVSNFKCNFNVSEDTESVKELSADESKSVEEEDVQMEFVEEEKNDDNKEIQ